MYQEKLLLITYFCDYHNNKMENLKTNKLYFYKKL